VLFEQIGQFAEFATKRQVPAGIRFERRAETLRLMFGYRNRSERAVKQRRNRMG